MGKIASTSLAFSFLILLFGYSAIGSTVDRENERRILGKVNSLQIPFIENRGQIKDKSVKYYARTFGGTTFITENGHIVYSIPRFREQKPNDGWVVKETLVGASVSRVKGEDKATAKVNYFKGKDPSKWKRDISSYDVVSLGEIYAGIELKLKAYGNNVEKLFYVGPGKHSENITVKVGGAGT